MASCVRCGQSKLRRDKHGRRKCKRCGCMPSAKFLDRGGNPPETSMTPSEIKAELTEIAKIAGPMGRAHMMLGSDWSSITYSCNPSGFHGREVSVTTPPTVSFEEGLGMLRQKLEGGLDEIKRDRVRALALLMIDKANPEGEIKTKLLLAGAFSADDLANYQEAALAEANRIRALPELKIGEPSA